MAHTVLHRLASNELHASMEQVLTIDLAITSAKQLYR